MCSPSRSARAPTSSPRCCATSGSRSPPRAGCCWFRWSRMPRTTGSCRPSPSWTFRCTAWTSGATASPSSSPRRRPPMSEAGVIHDIGYQRYTGPRLGRSAVFGAIYQHGMRAAFGLGRSAKAKIFPWAVAAIVLLVAVIAAAVKAQANITLFDYFGFADAMSWLVIFFVAIVAPELVSRDMRSGVLPLYFSRPLRAADYVGAKYLALATSVWLLLGVPQLIMFV